MSVFLCFLGGGELPACVNEVIMNSSIRNKSQIITHSWRHMVITATQSAQASCVQVRLGKN